MRSITVTLWVTLDGVVQGVGRADEDTRGGFTHGGWGHRFNDEVLGREMAQAMAKPGDMLFGRRTWQDFITAWSRLTDGNPVTTHMSGHQVCRLEDPGGYGCLAELDPAGRRRGVITDGPYAEGKEHIGGIYVITAPDMDAALAWGAQGGGRDHTASRGPPVPGRPALLMR